jgi:hypothetical protein
VYVFSLFWHIQAWLKIKNVTAVDSFVIGLWAGCVRNISSIPDKGKGLYSSLLCSD